MADNCVEVKGKAIFLDGRVLLEGDELVRFKESLDFVLKYVKPCDGLVEIKTAVDACG